MTLLHLSIGELARRAGVTVRTLHHYDAIGLVSPSARSEAGYRLYARQDIERLHAVQSLKQLGLALEAIAEVLEGGGISPQELLQRQVSEAQRRLEEAQQLKDRLLFLQDAMQDKPANAEDLLAGIHLLQTHQLHLPASDIRQMLERWRRARPRWQPIAEALLQCRQDGLAVECEAVQLLTQRWMNQAMAVFGGRLSVVLDWAQMHQRAPQTAAHAGLESELLEYLGRAIGLRMEALQRHLSADELRKLDGSTGAQWEKFAQQGHKLLAQCAEPQSRAAHLWLKRYRALSLRTVGGDAALAAQLARAYAREPVLALGHFVGAELRSYLQRIEAAEK